MTKNEGTRTPEGAWVEFDDGYDPRTDADKGPRIVRVFSSEVAALRSAVSHGNDVVRLQYGESIEEAIGRLTTEPEAPAPKRIRTTRTHKDVDDVTQELPESAN